MVCRPEFSDQIGFTVETPGQFFGPGGKGDMITHDTLVFPVTAPPGRQQKKAGSTTAATPCDFHTAKVISLPS
jgi:hypothetical protein